MTPKAACTLTDEPPRGLDERGGLEGLSDHLVGPVAVLGDVGRAGDHDDRDPGVPELAEEDVGGLAVEVHVEEDDVRPLRRHGIAGLLERPRFADLEPLQLEVHPAQEAQARVVFYNQYGCLPIHGGRS